jgi:ubiquinol-cytochrome c reductase cytochrome c subunit
MSRRFFISIALGAALFAPSLAGAAGDPGIDHGKAVFMTQNCYLCHGTVGQGGAGPTIAPPKLVPFTQFSAWLRNTGSGDMPVYTAKVLSDADVSAIYGYLRSLPGPPSPLPALLRTR